MGVKRKIFLILFKRQVKEWRSNMKLKGLWKVLDGYKLMLGVGGLFLVGVWDAMTNGHAGDIVGAILTALNWLPPADGEWSGEAVSKAAFSFVAVVGFFAKLWKANRQLKAGASLTQTLSTEGFVKQGIVQGLVMHHDDGPMVPRTFAEIKPEQVSFVAKIVYGILKALLGGHLKIGKVDIPLPMQKPGIGGERPFDIPHKPGPGIGR